MNKPLLKHYQDALSAWEGGACNPIALTNHLNQAVQDLRDLGSTELARHPVVRLYLAQLSSLAGIGIGDCNNADEEARAYISANNGDKPVHTADMCEVGSDTYQPCMAKATKGGMCDKHADMG